MKNFKRRFLASLFACLLMMSALMPADMSVVFAATSGSCGTNATWNYNSTTKTLTISGTGATKDYRDTTNKLLRTEQAPWIEYKSLIENVVVNEGITEIGDYAFFECTALTNVSLPETLTKLDGWGGAVGNVDKTYGCFQSCTALENITLPSSLTEIESYVFNGCTALTKIDIPNDVTTIGKYAFFDCSALERVTFGISLENLGENAFRNTGLKRISWNTALTALPKGAFFNCGFVELEIPDTVTSIGQEAFKNNTFLRTLTVNNANTTFNGNVCEGSNQSVTVRGHAGSTAQTFAEQYSYAFESIDACPHENTHEVVTAEPNCTETGTKQVICDDCGEVVRNITIDALGHTWGEEPVEEDDRTAEDGHIYKTYLCTVCNAVKTDAVHQYTSGIDPENIDPSAIDFDTSNLVELINRLRNFDWSSLSEEPVYVWVDGYYTKTTLREATCTQYGGEYYKCNVEGCNKRELRPLLPSHNVTSWTVTKPATCTEAGERRGTCADCGETVTETIKATGHTYDEENPTRVYDNAEDGHTHKVYVCQNCGGEIEEYVHNEWIEGLYTPYSTSYDNCELPGAELDICDICGESRTVTVPARGEHDLYETSYTEPTCTARGKHYMACHNCQYTTTQYEDALGHDFVRDDSRSTDATCTEAGSIFYNCSRCSASKTESVEALGHTPAEDTWVVDTQPTCTKTGTGHGHCSRCDTDYTATIEALGHDYQPIETDLTSEGKPGHVLSVPQCTRCNSRETGEIVHKEWTEGNYNVTTTTPGTCTTGATEIRQCTICNKIGTVETESPLGHEWSYSGMIEIPTGENTGNIQLPGGLSIGELTGGTSYSNYIINKLDEMSVEAEYDEEKNVVTYHGKVTKDGVTFFCPYCMTTTTKPIAEVRALWTFDLLNTAPNRSALVVHNKGEEDEYTEDTDFTSYLDLNGDGIINGRDWAYIKSLTALEAEAAAEAEQQAEPQE